MIYKNLEIIAITHDIPEEGLKKGNTGTIVEVYNDGKAYEVEFVAPDGGTIALLTLDPSDLRSLGRNPAPTWNESVWRGFKQQI